MSSKRSSSNNCSLSAGLLKLKRAACPGKTVLLIYQWWQTNNFWSVGAVFFHSSTDCRTSSLILHERCSWINFDSISVENCQLLSSTAPGIWKGTKSISCHSIFFCVGTVINSSDPDCSDNTWSTIVFPSWKTKCPAIRSWFHAKTRTSFHCFHRSTKSSKQLARAFLS